MANNMGNVGTLVFASLLLACSRDVAPPPEKPPLRDIVPRVTDERETPSPPTPGGVQGRHPIEVTAPPYTRSAPCEPCHRRQYADWYASFHRTMTQAPSAKTVAGDFSGAPMTFDGIAFRARREGDDYWIEQGGTRNKVSLMTGSHHTQVYWYDTGKGKQLRMFPLVYLIGERRWAPDYGIFLKPRTRFVAEENGMWNHNCILCHTTQGRPRDWDRVVDTEAAELGIACEACHGPGQAHVKAAESSDDDKGTGIVNPKALPAHRSAAICGSCHGVQAFRPGGGVHEWNRSGRGAGWAEEGTPPLRIVRPRQDADAPYLRELLKEDPTILTNHFWSDGTIRVTGREYNGLIDSPCFAGGKFSCLSCHEMHRRRDDRRPAAAWADDQLMRGMDSDQACVQCHQKYRAPAAQEKHSHHSPRSAASRCTNCHMPNTTYGLLKATRSHQISSPRVVAGGDSQRPNACSLCHLDRTLRWTADKLGAWYGTPRPAGLTADQEAIASGVLWSLKGDAGIRALVAWTMGWKPAQEAAGTAWMPPYLATLMNDSYVTPRLLAHRSLRTIAGYGDFDFDYVGSAAARVAAMDRIMKTWKAAAGAGGTGQPAVLVEAGGQLAHARIAQLLGKRDETPIRLQE